MVVDRAEITRIVADCVRYWRETGVPRKAIEEMRIELEQHLVEADARGQSPDRVVGPDLGDFAESWAAEQRSTPAVSWSDVTSGRVERRRLDRHANLVYGIGTVSLVAGVIAGTQLSGGGTVDNEIWRWFWSILAVVSVIAEIFTAGFFLLPIGIGATAAAVLSWVGVSPLAQWLVFFGVTAIAFAYLRRYARHQDDDQPKVGANRWAGARGIVTGEIDPDHSRGMVRVEGEEWRATTEGEIISEGERIVVKEIRGSKLLVARVDGEPSM